MFKFNLGDKVKDTITGFTGVVIGRFEWLNGCRRYAIQCTRLTKEGLPQDAKDFDEQQLETAGKPIKVKQSNTGGPRRSVQLPTAHKPW